MLCNNHLLKILSFVMRVWNVLYGIHDMTDLQVTLYTFFFINRFVPLIVLVQCHSAALNY